jgi:formylglycine-generating enzyme required for sulfatase activity
MVHFAGPVEFLMGSPLSEKGRSGFESPHVRRIERSFAIASKKVTVRDFEAFRKVPAESRRWSPDPDAPVVRVTWHEAAAYCRWLSEQENIPEEEMCYPSVQEILTCREEGTPLKLPGNYLSRKGYRMPTEAELEYACRAETTTARFYGGGGEELLAVHAWYQRNTQDHTWPVGQKRPNDFGMFDMLGNTFDWSQGSIAVPLDRPDSERRTVDREEQTAITDRQIRVLRGGSFSSLAPDVRAAFRTFYGPRSINIGHGLRVARTL